MKYVILLGNFTFLDEQLDKVVKAIVHSIDTVVVVDREEQVDEFLEFVESGHMRTAEDSYLVIGQYQHPIEFDDRCFIPENLKPLLLGDAEDKKLNRERTIAIIKRIVDVWGAFSPSEVDATSSPVISVLGAASQLAEYFTQNGVDAITYVHETETNSEFVSYDDLPTDTLEQIYALALDWEKQQGDENASDEDE